MIIRVGFYPKGSLQVDYSGNSRLFLIVILALAVFHPANARGDWKTLEEGLELGIFTSPQPAETGDSIIRILRINLHFFGLKLLNASASKDGRPLSAREWSERHQLQAAINASMYQEDLKTSVSLMWTRGHINNPRLSKDKAILAFNPKNPTDAPVRIIDRQCDSFHELMERYWTLIQSIRMISCRGTNVWQEQSKQWSTAVLALDRTGKVLFIHVKSPYNPHTLIQILQSLPLSIERAMYLEGGPQAQLFIRSGGHHWDFFGRYTGTFASTAPPRYSHPIPNIIGVFRKPTSIKKK